MPKIRPVQEGKAFCTKCCIFKLPEDFYVSNHVKNSLKLTYVCKECSKKKIHEYRNTESGFWVSVWNNLVGNSKNRGLSVSITKDDIQDLWKRQNGLCAITGFQMELAKSQKTSRARSFSPYRLSIDRIDNSAGYTKDNIRIVCAYVNIMRMDMTDAQLKFWCEAITKGMNNG
jgi:hypothetical protein